MNAYYGGMKLTQNSHSNLVSKPEKHSIELTFHFD